MKALKFRLSGNTAFFKKPDVNSCIYFTYGCIHKISLLGIFGAILGYSGYNSNKLKTQLKDKKSKEKEGLPEFYEKLKDIKVSVVPLNDKGFIPKKIQTFNNSVGYASHEQGGNLIVKEQWLYNPAWDIYVLLDTDESLKISDYITNNKAVYLPYLGKNDHYADITDAQIIDNLEITNKSRKIDSLCPKNNFEFEMPEDDDFESDDIIEVFKYEEKLPVSLDETLGMYVYDTFVYTNMEAVACNMQVYKTDSRNIVFY